MVGVVKQLSRIRDAIAAQRHKIETAVGKQATAACALSRAEGEVESSIAALSEDEEVLTAIMLAHCSMEVY